MVNSAGGDQSAPLMVLVYRIAWLGNHGVHDLYTDMHTGCVAITHRLYSAYVSNVSDRRDNCTASNCCSVQHHTQKVVTRRRHASWSAIIGSGSLQMS